MLQRTGKDPVVIGAEIRPLPPRLQHANQFVVELHGPARVVGFDVVNNPVDYATLDIEKATDPVDICPFQGHRLANPQPKAHAQNSHRLKRLSQLYVEQMELIHCETARLSQPLRRALHRN